MAPAGLRTPMLQLHYPLSLLTRHLEPLEWQGAATPTHAHRITENDVGEDGRRTLTDCILERRGAWRTPGPPETF